MPNNYNFKKDVWDLEKKISNLVIEFEKETGLSVENIEIFHNLYVMPTGVWNEPLPDPLNAKVRIGV